MEKKEIMVSIHCLAYNHEKYIADALESFLMQKTTFAYEVLIHDDASTDGTADIIRKYEDKYPDIIKPIYQKENQYSKHINILTTYQLPRMKGKYYAVCEGDDYWTDPYKLQKQFEAMEKHPELDICSHRALLVNSEDKTIVSESIPAKETCIIPVEKVIEGGGGFVMTCSLFLRKDYKASELPFRNEYCFDYTLQISGALRGGMLYLDDCMSAYRVLSQNSWVRSQKNDPNKLIKHKEYVSLMLKQLDVDTNKKYHGSVKKALHRINKITFLRAVKHFIHF